MNPVAVKSRTFVDFNKKIIKKVLNNSEIQKCFYKSYVPNYPEEVFVI